MLIESSIFRVKYVTISSSCQPLKELNSEKWR